MPDTIEPTRLLGVNDEATAHIMELLVAMDPVISVHDTELGELEKAHVEATGQHSTEITDSVLVDPLYNVCWEQNNENAEYVVFRTIKMRTVAEVYVLVMKPGELRRAFCFSIPFNL